MSALGIVSQWFILPLKPDQWCQVLEVIQVLGRTDSALHYIAWRMI